MTGRSLRVRCSRAAIAAGFVVATVLAALGVTAASPAVGSTADQTSTSGAQEHSHRVVYPTVELVRGRPERNARAGFAKTSTSPITYRGGNHGIGVTPGPPRVYLVFWGSQ